MSLCVSVLCPNGFICVCARDVQVCASLCGRIGGEGGAFEDNPVVYI